jgi:hypothetical protein
VAELMRSLSWRINVGSLQRMRNDRSDGSLGFEASSPLSHLRNVYAPLAG